MISSDQPGIFNDASVMVRFSSKSDGTMLDRTMGVHDESVVRTREAFCRSIGLDYADIAYQRIIYADTASYALLAEIDARNTTLNTAEVVADAIYTESPGVGIFLPVADCVATIIADPTRKAMAVLHLGRHSTLTDLLPKTLRHFTNRGSKPADLRVWLSPSARMESYKLDYFDRLESPEWADYASRYADGTIHIDMQGYNAQILTNHGVPTDHIEISLVDTVTDHNYFSHTAGDTTGRQALVAYLR